MSEEKKAVFHFPGTKRKKEKKDKKDTLEKDKKVVMLVSSDTNAESKTEKPPTSARFRIQKVKKKKGKEKKVEPVQVKIGESPEKKSQVMAISLPFQKQKPVPTQKPEYVHKPEEELKMPTWSIFLFSIGVLFAMGFAGYIFWKFNTDFLTGFKTFKYSLYVFVIVLLSICYLIVIIIYLFFKYIKVHNQIYVSLNLFFLFTMVKKTIQMFAYIAFYKMEFVYLLLLYKVVYILTVVSFLPLLYRVPKNNKFIVLILTATISVFAILTPLTELTEYLTFIFILPVSIILAKAFLKSDDLSDYMRVKLFSFSLFFFAIATVLPQIVLWFVEEYGKFIVAVEIIMFVVYLFISYSILNTPNA